MSLQLNLPPGTVVPAFYGGEESAKDISTALRVGAEAVVRARTIAASDHAALRADKQTSAFEAELALLSEERDALTAKIRLLESGRESLRAQLTADFETRLESRLDQERCAWERDARTRLSVAEADVEDARAQLTRTEAARDAADASMVAELARVRAMYDHIVKDTEAEKARIRDEERARYTQMLDDASALHAEATRALKETVATFKEEAARQREAHDQEMSLRDRELRSAEDARKDADILLRTHAGAKGDRGEVTLAATLTNAFGIIPGFIIEDSSKRPHSGDVILSMFGVRTLWDSKAHTARRTLHDATLRNIEYKEVVKIKADLARNPDVDIGFLVALKTGIARHAHRAIDIEFINSSQVLVYINRLLERDNPVAFLQDYVLPVVHVVAKWKSLYVELDESADAARTARLLTRLKAITTDMTKLLGDARRRLREDKKRSQERIAASANSLDALKRHLDETLRAIAAFTDHHHDDDTHVHDEARDSDNDQHVNMSGRVPPPSFRKRRRCGVCGESGHNRRACPTQ